MSNIVQISDFKGAYDISVNQSVTNHLQEIIDTQENEYLTNLMGVDLRDLFVADLVNGVPQEADYLKFFNEFEEVYMGKLLRSKGLKKTLLGLIFHDFVSRDNYRHTLTGLVSNANENSEVLNARATYRFSESKRNEIVESYNLISRKIKELELYDYSDTIEVSYLDLI